LQAWSNVDRQRTADLPTELSAEAAAMVEASAQAGPGQLELLFGGWPLSLVPSDWPDNTAEWPPGGPGHIAGGLLEANQRIQFPGERQGRQPPPNALLGFTD